MPKFVLEEIKMNKYLKLISCTVSIFFALTSVAAAASPLKGINAVNIDGVNFDKDSEACGLGKASRYMLIARRALDDANIASSPEEPIVFWISPLTLYAAKTDTCITTLRIEVSEFIDVMVPHNQNEKVESEIMYWSNSFILTSSPLKHRAMLEDAVKDLTDAFITDWKKAN